MSVVISEPNNIIGGVSVPKQKKRKDIAHLLCHKNYFGCNQVFWIKYISSIPNKKIRLNLQAHLIHYGEACYDFHSLKKNPV